MDYSKIIATDPLVQGGRPCIRDTQVWVSDVLAYLEEGMSEAQILAELPDLTHDDISACQAFAAAHETEEALAEALAPIRNPDRYRDATPYERDFLDDNPDLSLETLREMLDEFGG